MRTTPWPYWSLFSQGIFGVSPSCVPPVVPTMSIRSVDAAKAASSSSWTQQDLGFSGYKCDVHQHHHELSWPRNKHKHMYNIYIYIYIIIYYYVYIYMHNIYIYTYTHTGTDRIMEKKNVSIYRRRLSMIEKLRTFFFPYVFFHNYFFFHNSVGDCMSIDSQFECILRGNIEL